MENKSNQSRDFAEYAEICRAAATTLRMATNVILNAPADGMSSFKSKKAFTDFLKRVDDIGKDLFKFFKEYEECARTLSNLEKESSSGTQSSVTAKSAAKN